MADISDEIFEKFLDELRKNSVEVGKMSKALSMSDKQRKKDREKAARENKQRKMDEARDKLAKKTDNLAESFSLLDGDANDLRHAFSRFARGIVGGAVLDKMVSGAVKLANNYHETAEVGQTFNGSIFGMARAAAEAGLPLQEFSSLIKKNSKIMATYGQKPIMELAKNVRQNAEKFGMYGYTLDGINDVTMQYMETQRLYGNVNAAANAKQSNAVGKLTAEISGLANTTGVARADIMNITSNAMRDVSLTSRFIGNQHTQMQAFADSTTKAVAVMAALPGEAGEVMSKFVSQTVGWGNSLFAEGGEMFINAGLGSMLGVVDQLSREILKGGDQVTEKTWDAISEFKSQVEQNTDALRLQAMAGNQDAARVLRMYSEIGTLTKEQYLQKQKEVESTKSLSALILSFSSISKRLLGALIGPIFGGLENVESKMQSLVDSPTFKRIETAFGEVGSSISSFINGLKPEQIASIADSLVFVIKGLGELSAMALQVVGGLIKFSKWVSDVTHSPLLGILAGVGVVALGKFIAGGISAAFGTFIKGMIGSKVRTMNVTAGKINLNGGGFDDFGQWGGGGDGPHGGGGGGKGNRKTNKAGKPRREGAVERLERMRKARGIKPKGPKRGIGGLIGGLLAGGAAAKIAEEVADHKVKAPDMSHVEETAERASNAAKEAAEASKAAGETAKSGIKASKAGVKTAEMSSKFMSRFGKLGSFGKFFGKEGTKAGAKGIGKSLLKKIPLVGLGMGALFGAQRLMSGDKVGAGMEFTSGLASMIPGVGTAASLAMDAAIMARDVAGPENVSKIVEAAVPKAMDAANSVAVPKTDDPAMTSMTDDLKTKQEKLAKEKQADENRKAHDDVMKAQAEYKKMLEVQIALLREQNELLKKNNQMTSTMVHGLI